MKHIKNILQIDHLIDKEMVGMKPISNCFISLKSVLL